MRRTTTLATLAAAVAASMAASAGPANAAVTSASFANGTATLNLDGADDNVTVSVVGGLLVHGQLSGGLKSGADWDSAKDGEQTVPATAATRVVVNGAGGNDALTVLAKDTELKSAILNGDTGDDVLTGADTKDTLKGGAGNDRLVGAKGDDTMSGGEDNDTLVWNNGDGTDVNDGDAGNDTSEVNGNATLGDSFSMDAVNGRIKFRRNNLGLFSIDASTEHFEVNGLGGDDSLTASVGVGALTLLSADGGAGDDFIRGGDGADQINGGEGADVLNGGPGDDRVVGDRGADTMNGAEDDDTLVWNNGDGTDVAEGELGRDDVELNGAPAAGDAISVTPNGRRLKIERTNLVPFSIDAGGTETAHVNGLGGGDTIAVGNVGADSVTAAGGSGNDRLTGGSSSETFLGGSGNDTIAPGGGIDVVSGDDGNDTVNVRDRTADLAHGGDGNDAVVADNARFDVLEGFETVSRTPAPVVTPPPGDATRPVTIRRGVVKVRQGTRTARIRVSCPAGSVDCTGSLALATAKRVRVAGGGSVLRLGSKRYHVASGKSSTVKVKLPRGIRRLADRKGHVKVRAVASTDTSGAVATSSRRLTLAFGPAHGQGR